MNQQYELVKKFQMAMGQPVLDKPAMLSNGLDGLCFEAGLTIGLFVRDMKEISSKGDGSKMVAIGGGTDERNSTDPLGLHPERI